MTLNPARLLKIDDRKDSITQGKDADIVIFDQDIAIDLVMVKGHILKNRL